MPLTLSPTHPTKISNVFRFFQAIMVHADEMVASACICCYSGFNFKEIKMLGSADNECLCFTENCCLNAGEKPFGPGMITDEDHICRLGLFCMACGLKKPAVLCAQKGHVLCCVQAAAFPTNPDYVPNPVCAAYCLQCTPNCGCCKPPIKEGGAPAVELTDAHLDAEAMDRV